MRRFDVYFLQKRDASGWETLERAQSASVLVSSMVREFDGVADAELRVVGGDWNAAIGEWEFSQIFFVDRGSIDLSLAEPSDDGSDEDGMWSSSEGDTPEPIDAPPHPTDGGFADAIRAAREEAVRHDTTEERDDELEPHLTASEPHVSRRPEQEAGQDAADDDATNEDLRSLGFTRNAMGVDEPVGPPPDFRPEPRSRGRAFFMVGTLLISLVLIAGVAIALMIFFKVDPAPRYIEMLKEWKMSSASDAEMGKDAAANVVMPTTGPDVETHEGVPEPLWGRWSSSDCADSYLEFDHAGFIVKSPGREPNGEVAVNETLEDEYTWYIRRSEVLIEHLQKLGENDIQLIGVTTPVGFTQRSSEVWTRCPG